MTVGLPAGARRVFLYAEASKAHQLAAMKAFAAGLRVHDIDYVIRLDGAGLGDSDLLVTWGARGPAPGNRPHLLLEAGYINNATGDYYADRLRFVSASWGALHGRADNRLARTIGRRFEQLGVELAPWRLQDGYALILDQHPNDAASPSRLEHASMLSACREAFDDVKVRPHPLIKSTGPLADDLAGAAVAVTWNSTAAVEAVIAGVPTITFDRGSIAWSVTSHELGKPYYLGGRGVWAYNLGFRQWTMTELADGSAWPAIVDQYAPRPQN